MDLSGQDFPGYQVPKAVTARFEADLEGDLLRVELSAGAEVVAECARCLAPVQELFTVEKTYTLKERELTQEDNDLPIDLKGVLDLDELVYQELVLQIPTVLLCSPDCLGLCPVCGKKKGAGCTCQESEDSAPADPRLSILRQLLN
ncbi:MAG: YceD family protein [Bacteroidales bacterium]|nr:YceD family protein [Fournierella massiliensis]MCI6739362.1 YceD family protein [Bacteroidales bacterium]